MNFVNNLHRREFLQRGGLLGLAAVAGLSAESIEALAQTADTLRIVNLNGNLAPVFDELLKEGKFYEEFDVKTETLNVTDGTKIIASLVSSNADLCGGTGFSGVFPAIERGAKVKIVAGSSLVPQTAIFTKRPDIREAKDLIGKTVGTGPLGAQLHELAVALMIKKGIDYTKVNFVNIGAVSSVFTSVVAGAVDAGFGTVDVFFEQEKYGVHALNDGVLWKELPDFTNQAMVTSDQAIAEKRGQMVKAMAAYARLFRYINTPGSKDAWIKARAVALNRDDPKEAEQQWSYFNTPGVLATNLVLKPEQFEFAQGINVRVGAQQKILPFEQVADMSIAQEAIKLLG
jgi:ABC-type nitrate/sulfonate/bicarbonate transport system substrate-binding protein